MNEINAWCPMLCIDIIITNCCRIIWKIFTAFYVSCMSSLGATGHGKFRLNDYIHFVIYMLMEL